MQKYLYYWLLLVGVGHIILGMVFIVIAKTSLITPYINSLYQVFDVSFNSANDQLLRTVLQLLGPTVVSWAALFCLAIHYYVKHGTTAIKQLIIIALLLWFAFDTGISMLNGINSHIVINSFVMLMILPPLLLLKPDNEAEYI